MRGGSSRAASSAVVRAANSSSAERPTAAASWNQYSALLKAATDAEPDQTLTVGAKHYRRLFTVGDARHAERHGRANIRVLDESTGRKVNVTFTEDAAFWQWAAVETLRHTGLRCEELLELSQLSIRQYARPNGEVVALLVVAPSKTDRERVIPMTAELFHVIATIIRRLTRNRRGVPLATRFDQYERITSEPQPFLFQRTIGQRTGVINPGTLRAELAKLSDALAVEHPELARCRFTPHDFRRLFATDLVNHGLPIHIGAALLGHLDVQTTHGYVTVFQEDVIRHYQAHLAGRRAARPAREYRGPRIRNGPNSKSTSTNARSSWAAAGGPTRPRASTSTPVFAARCSKSIR